MVSRTSSERLHKESFAKRQVKRDHAPPDRLPR